MPEYALKEYTLKDKNVALATAIADRDVPAVINSLQKGAEINFDDGFPLRCAAYLGYTEIAELLLKNGANVHANKEEPLFTAIRARDRALIDLLLEKGASLQAVIDGRKGQLDPGSINLIDEIKARDDHAASARRRAELLELAKKRRPNIKAGAP